jgi:hypothetical protein
MIGGTNRNSGRTRNCDTSALSIDPVVLRRAVLLGNRATNRAATRNLRKLNARQDPSPYTSPKASTARP